MLSDNPISCCLPFGNPQKPSIFQLEMDCECQRFLCHVRLSKVIPSILDSADPNMCTTVLCPYFKMQCGNLVAISK